MRIPPEEAPTFNYYLERHIELDRDSHGPIAIDMVRELCGNDQIKWDEAGQAAISSIQARIKLWDDLMIELKA